VLFTCRQVKLLSGPKYNRKPVWQSVMKPEASLEKRPSLAGEGVGAVFFGCAAV
jgi:hypothetical protein